MAWPTAFHQRAPCVRQYRRRHLRPFGSLAIRQAIAADVPITYKILYNGFVSMTGGQPIEGGMTPVQILAECAAEGVKKMALVVDTLSATRRAPASRRQPAPPRRDGRNAARISRIQGRLGHPLRPALRDGAPSPRKRGKWADPAIRTFIHPEVCEGCGDCGRVSNCMAIEPLETEFGRKRRINQSSCNKDFSCVEGFCPSFVTVHGGRLRKPQAASPVSRYLPPLPEPVLPNGRALQLAGGRHRRLRRGHCQPDARRRRPSRRALQLQSRFDWPQPEIGP